MYVCGLAFKVLAHCPTKWQQTQCVLNLSGQCVAAVSFLKISEQQQTMANFRMLGFVTICWGRVDVS